MGIEGANPQDKGPKPVSDSLSEVFDRVREGRDFEPTPTGGYKKALRRQWDLEDRLRVMDDKQGSEAAALFNELNLARAERESAWHKLQDNDPDNAEAIQSALFQERSIAPNFDLGPEEDQDE